MRNPRKYWSIALAGAVAAMAVWGSLAPAIAQEASIETSPPVADAAALPVAASPAIAPAAAEAPATASAPATDPPAPAEAAGKIEPRVMDGVISHWPLQNAPIRLVLRQLAMLSQKNIIASKEVDGNVTADLYNVTFREALNAVLSINGYDYLEKGNFIYVYTAKQIESIRKAQMKMSVRAFPVFYVRPDDAKALILPCMSPDGLVAITPAAKAGIATSSSITGGADFAADDVLVVRDYDENLEAIAMVLKSVDQRPQQVLIEATILRATLTEDTALGIDFNTLAGVDFKTLASTSDGLTNLNTGTVSGNTLEGNKGTFRTDFNTNVPQGGLSIGFIGNDVSFFLRALESITDATVLANPKLLVVNKQRGEVLVGRRDGYKTTSTTETATVETVQFLETGTRLVVRPYIGEGGNVRLEIHPEDSSGSVVAGLPSQRTTECTSNVIVRDGRTIIIGGLFRELTTAGRSQVPVLGNIPLAGAAFRSTSDNTTREEVIILITPRIIKQGADEAASERLKDDVERFQAGARQGLQWFDSSRLAACHLRWAKENLAKGKTSQAMWDLNLALNISPRLAEALDLKECLTGQATWANEPRTSSVRYVIQKMVMSELGIDPNLVIPPVKPLDANLLPDQAREALGIQNAPGPRPMELLDPADESDDPEQPAPAEIDQAEPTLLKTTSAPADSNGVEQAATQPSTQPAAASADATAEVTDAAAGVSAPEAAQ